MSQRNVLGIPFAGGVDEKTSEPWLQPGQQHRTVQNGVFTRVGAISKRRGMTALAMGLVGAVTGSSVSSCARLVTYKNELDTLDGNGLYAYSSAAGGWVSKGLVPPCVATRQSVSTTTGYPFAGDVSEGSGYRVTAWWVVPPASFGSSYFGSVYVTVTDMTLGTSLYSGYLLAPGSYFNVKCFVLNGFAVVLYSDSSGAIYGQRLNLSTMGSAGWSGILTLVSGHAFISPWDAAPIVGDPAGHFVIAYQTLTSHLGIYRFANDFTGGTSAVSAEANGGYLTIAVRATFGESIFVAYSFNGAGPTYYVKATYFNASTLVEGAAPSVVASGATQDTLAVSLAIERVTSTHALVAWTAFQGSVPSGDQVMYWVPFDIAGGAALGPRRAGYHLVLVSKLWTFGGRVYGVLQKISAIQPTMYVSELSLDTSNTDVVNPRAVATVAPRVAQAYGAPSITLLGNITGVSNQGSSSATSFTFTAAIASNSDNQRAEITNVVVDYASTTIYRPGEVGENLHLSCGTPTFYDGNAPAEIGFLYYPELNSVGGSANVTQSAGGPLANGTYQYTMTYEWVDAYGQIHRSAPSVPASVTVTGAGNNKVTIAAPTLGLTQRMSGDVKLVVYRTQVGGTVFYRTTSLNSAATNNPNAATVTIVDASTDSQIATNPLLYDTGGVIDNLCPPSATGLCIFKDRVWLIGDDGKTLWYSKSQATGEAPGFNDTLTLTVDEGGPVTAIATMDDKLVVFKRDKIFIIEGDGPADTGAGSDLTVPHRVSSDVGCIEPRSVVLTPVGLMFQGAAGLYLLSRALEVTFFGRAVLDTLSSFSTITSATLVPADNVVVFTCLNTVGFNSGLSLVYDYIQQAWGSYLYGAAAQFVSGVLLPTSAGGLYAIAQRSGAVYLQKLPSDPTAYIDTFGGGPQWITLMVETAWFKMTGMLGFKRVRAVQLFVSTQDRHNLTVSAGFNFISTSYPQNVTFTATQLDALDREEVEMRLQNARCEAVRFQISDALPNDSVYTNGAGPSLEGLAIEWVAHQGLSRRPAAARM